MPDVRSDPPTATSDDADDIAGRIADEAMRSHCTVAVAESLTGGMLSSQLAAARRASEWFRGGIVAYATAVKHDLLDVPAGPVVSEAASVAMARGAARLLGAHISVAVTGVGGPGRQDDQPPGTVWIAIFRGGNTEARLHHIDGPTAAAICSRTCGVAQRALLSAIADGRAPAPRHPGRRD